MESGLVSTLKNNGFDLEQLLNQLDHYRRQTQWLAEVNRLHSRLAAATDLQGMIEVFSVWASPHLSHDMVAARVGEGGRLYMVCSTHGPDRQRMASAAQCLMDDDFRDSKKSGLYHEMMEFQGDGGVVRFLILRKGRPFGLDEREFLEKTRGILGEPLQRAILYEDVFDQARRDTLTGLENRRVFDERVASVVAQARRHGRPVTLACMDLDHFKQVNDIMGHLAGDRVLQQVAAVLRENVREADLLVRMGGDEFVALLPDTDIEASRHLARRLCAAVDSLEVEPREGARLGISIGLVQWNDSFDGIEEWLRAADEALYQAKKEGRGRCKARLN